MDGILRTLIGGLDLLARAANLDVPLRTEKLLDGLDRCGRQADPAQRQALTVLLRAAAEEARLNLFGHQALRWDLLRLLGNGQRVEWQLALQPALARAPVTSPFFILGLPRTGSTFLHRLLAEDPDNAVVRCWQTMAPAPRPMDFDAQSDTRARRAQRALDMFGRLAPELASLHPLGAELPQECTEITAHTFRSFAFDTMFHVPGYRDWLDRQDHAGVYGFHRRFLQLLQDGVPRRWVLKCPDHVFALDGLLRVYPDARLIVTHRDPVAVIPSVARLTQVLRQPFSRHVDPLEVGAEVTERWIEGAARLAALAQRGAAPATQVFHLHYIELVSDPVAVVQRIYRHFGLRLNALAHRRMQSWVACHPRGGYGRNHYPLEAFGLRRGPLERAFAGYREFFRIVPWPSQAA